MRTSVLILALLLAGCGKVKLEHEVKGKVDPVEVKHYIVLDTEKLEKYYRLECEKQFTTQEEIDDCTNEQLGKFIEQFTYQT